MERGRCLTAAPLRLPTAPPAHRPTALLKSCLTVLPSRCAHSLTVAAQRDDRLLLWPGAPTVCDLDRASDLRGQLPCCHADLLAAPPPC